MEILLLVLLSAGVIWQVSRVVSRMRSVSIPAPATPLEYRRFNASLELDPRLQPDWIECPVCECPMYNRAGDFPGCELCGWEAGEGDGESELAEARAAFANHGTAHSPEAGAAWGARPLSSEEREHVRAIVALHRRACAGELDYYSWEAATLKHLEDLRRSRVG